MSASASSRAAVGSSTSSPGSSEPAGSVSPLSLFGELDSCDRATVCVKSNEHVARLAAEVKRAARDQPIVALTSREGERQPSVPAARVRAIVGPRVMISVIASTACDRLNRQLPAGLRVSRGALRVWWPSPARTIVIDETGEFGEAFLLRVEYEFLAGLRTASGYVQMLERSLSEAEVRCAGLARELERLRAHQQS